MLWSYSVLFCDYKLAVLCLMFLFCDPVYTPDDATGAKSFEYLNSCILSEMSTSNWKVFLAILCVYICIYNA